MLQPCTEKSRAIAPTHPCPLLSPTVETDNRRSTKSRERSSRGRTSSPSRAELSNSRNGSSAEVETKVVDAAKADGQSGQSGGRNGDSETSSSRLGKPSDDTLTRGAEGSSRERRGSADPVGAAAAASTERGSPRKRSPTATPANERVDSGTTEAADQTSSTAVPGNDDATITGSIDNSAGGVAKQEQAAAETTTVQGSTAAEPGEDCASPAVAAAVAAGAVVRESKDGATGAPCEKLSSSSNDGEASGDGKKSEKQQPDTADDARPSALPPPSKSGSPYGSDSNRPSGAADAGDGRSRRRSSGSGDLSPFIRNNGRRRPDQEPAAVSPITTPAANDTAAAVPTVGSSAPDPASSQANRTPSDGGVTDGQAASASTSQRASVFSRLGTPPSETKKDGAKVAATASTPGRSSSGNTPDSAPPPSRGIEATWGSGNSAEGASSKGNAGDGEVNAGGNAGVATAGAADPTAVRTVKVGGKDEARPVGGGAGRLMNAALSSSRDSGRGGGKKGGASGRGAQGSGRRQRE